MLKCTNGLYRNVTNVIVNTIFYAIYFLRKKDVDARKANEFSFVPDLFDVTSGNFISKNPENGGFFKKKLLYCVKECIDRVTDLR